MKTILEKWIKIAETIASYWLQQVTDSRNQELVAQGVIAQYTADVSHAGLLPARAAYQQLRGLQSYEPICAKTDGIITTRYVDPGAFIPRMTSPGGATPIVELATLHPLRVYEDLPQDLAAFVKRRRPGDGHGEPVPWPSNSKARSPAIPMRSSLTLGQCVSRWICPIMIRRYIPGSIPDPNSVGRRQV